MNDLLSPLEVEKLAAANGLTMKEVCEKAEIAQSTFSRWKAGKTAPSIDIYSRVITAASKKAVFQAAE